MNQSTAGKIKLFSEVLSCRDCLFSWQGYVHGFSRGHTVLKKGNRILFIPDDIAYCFPEAANFNYSEIFEKVGWKDLEACPKCESKNLFLPIYDQEKMEEVDCIFIEPKDMEELNGVWSLASSGQDKLNRSEPDGARNRNRGDR